jgi:adenosylcobinamide-GDP ribazoletransferase
VVVGTLVAGLTAVLLQTVPGFFAPLVAAVLGTAWSVWITGAFHEDGLADVADGLGGSYDRERALTIMKDSRVGAFGAIAVVLALVAKVALLAVIGSVGAVWMCAAIMGAHVVSRTWPLLLIRLLPHVGDADGSKSKPLADQITLPSLLVALVWCVGALTLTVLLQSTLQPDVRMPLAWGAGLMGSALAFWRAHALFARRLQGFTGDCLGTTQQVCELAFYLGFAMGLGVAAGT